MKFHALAGALALACLATPALADDTQGPWGASPQAQVILPPRPAARSRRHPVRTDYAAPLDIRPGAQLLAEMQKLEGVGKFTPYAGPWCRDALNAVAARAGVHLANHSRRAIDALHLGTRVASPQPGGLVVLRHHVTIYAGHSGGRIVGLGGNQGHRVRYSHYSPRRVLAFVRL